MNLHLEVDAAQGPYMLDELSERGFAVRQVLVLYHADPRSTSDLLCQGQLRAIYVRCAMHIIHTLAFVSA